MQSTLMPRNLLAVLLCVSHGLPDGASANKCCDLLPRPSRVKLQSTEKSLMLFCCPWESLSLLLLRDGIRITSTLSPFSPSLVLDGRLGVGVDPRIIERHSDELGRSCHWLDFIVLTEC